MKSRDGSGETGFQPGLSFRSGPWTRTAAFLLRALLVALLLTSAGADARAQLRLSEFMASNTRTLKDEDGSYEDWIELQNTTATNVDAGGWFLTDAAGKPTKWMLPSTNIRSGGFLVVFASGKDRRVPGQPLHTNFKLDASGDYLALVAPDGVRRVTEFAPQYPPQFPDLSFGLGTQVNPVTLVATNVPYLGRGKQDEVLQEYCERVHTLSKADLATCFVERCLEFCTSTAPAPRSRAGASARAAPSPPRAPGPSG